MARYHINPNTGNPNVCPDEEQCKFASEEGFVPTHYETQADAKEAVAAQIFAAFSATQTLDNTSQALTNTSDTEEELRGSERLEKAIKLARKLDNSIGLKLPVYRAKLDELRKNAFSVINLAAKRKSLKQS